MRATCHVANTRVYLGFDTKGSRLRNFSLFIGDDTKYWIFLNGQFPFSFILFFVFLKQFFEKVDGKWKLPMTGFEPQISGVWSNCSTNCATTTAPYYVLEFVLPILARRSEPTLWGYSTISGSSLVSTIIIGWLGIASKVIRQSREWYFLFFKSVDYSWIFLHVPALEVLFTAQITGFRNSEHWP